MNATCSTTKSILEKWPKHFPKDSLTKALCGTAFELPQECCHRSFLTLNECWNELLPFISEAQPEEQGSGQLQAHTKCFPAHFECQRQEGRDVHTGELPGAGINRTWKEEPNGRQTEMPPFPTPAWGNPTTQANQCKSKSATRHHLCLERLGLHPWQSSATAPDANTPFWVTKALKIATLKEGTANLPQQIVCLVWVIAQVAKHPA